MQSIDLRSNKTTLAELAYTVLLKSIISHELKPGDSLHAKELASLLGISRTPVERALERLSGEGLVKIQPGMPPRVFVPTPNEVLELYDIAALLEANAVEYSISRVDEQFLGELEGLLEEYEASLTAVQTRIADYEAQLRLREADRAVHQCLVSLWSNCKAQELYKQLNVHIKAFLMVNGIMIRPREELLGEHQVIFTCLKDKDATEAVEAVRDHIANNKSAFLTKTQAGQKEKS